MTTFPDIQAQVQVAHWGWDIAVFLWFVGLSGMGTLAYFWLRKRAIAYMTLATILLGLVVVASHLSRWWNLPGAVFNALLEFSFNWGSWMMLGVVLLSIQAAICLVLALHHYLEPPAGQARSGLAATIAALATSDLLLGVCAGFGVFVTAYSGFLLTAAVGVPLWNTALLPILWVVSAGAAVLALLELFHLAGWIDASAARTVTRLALATDSLKLLMLFAFIVVGLTAGSAGARAGANELLSGSLAPMLWIGVIGAGVLVPLAAGTYALRGGHAKLVVVTASVLALAGGLLLRAAVLLAGQFETLVF